MTFHKIKFIFFKEMFHERKMIRLTEIRAILKKNKIRGYLHYIISQLIDVLMKRGLLPETINTTTITSLPEEENTKVLTESN